MIDTSLPQQHSQGHMVLIISVLLFNYMYVNQLVCKALSIYRHIWHV